MSESTSFYWRRVDDLAGQLGGRVVRIMEICGTHTVSLFRSGIRDRLPEQVKLISGPGCPVCVTAQGYIDAACDLAMRPEVVIATYGDMLRVPGSDRSLEDCRAAGAQVQVVYSALDVLALAESHPDREVVFLGIGFETTTPMTAVLIEQADRMNLERLSVLPAHKLIMPVMPLLLDDPSLPIDGFLLPGHVSVVLGARVFEVVASQYHRPAVVAGFEPAVMLEALACLLGRIVGGEAVVDNCYQQAVTASGNPAAQQAVSRVMEPVAAAWRGMGVVADSGLAPNARYARFDAAKRFGVEIHLDCQPAGCACGQVIQGKVEPADCPLFAKQCTPTRPIGPCMVSQEGTCAAWYRFARHGRSGR